MVSWERSTVAGNQNVFPPGLRCFNKTVIFFCPERTFKYSFNQWEFFSTFNSWLFLPLALEQKALTYFSLPLERNKKKLKNKRTRLSKNAISFFSKTKEGFWDCKQVQHWAFEASVFSWIYFPRWSIWWNSGGPHGRQPTDNTVLEIANHPAAFLHDHHLSGISANMEKTETIFLC